MQTIIESYLVERLNPIILEDLLTITTADLPWEEFDGKTVLISGGSGFLASYLVQSLLLIRRLRGLSINIECVVRNMESAKVRFQAWSGESDFNIFCHDISRPLPDNFPRADFIIHCASQASPKYYGSDPVGTLLANSIGTNNLLEHALKSSALKFMFFSSGEVYGAPVREQKLVAEDDYGYLDPMKVRSCYAESKRIGETMCVAWGCQYNLQTVIVRPFHTYGPGMSLDDGRVFADFVADVVAGRSIVLRSNGLALRPFCYLSDASVGFFTALLRGEKSEAYNVGNPLAEISIKDLAITLSELLPERRVGVTVEFSDNKSYMQSPVLRSCPSISKLEKLGWFPRVGIREGFSRTIRSFLNR